ncbi:unnamed protein product [Macrosiphum euphorbiae]|uniref:Uncharacterized protein n=1 Tax=Macrosiphum euphorbiae TaxID=13131 RepID=A0AAV0XUA2_9HEMI|nr:unnamed protein product [Macrosiphum euphorbiae]
MAYSLLSDGKFASTTIVHYFGSTDGIIETPHENTNLKPENDSFRPHVMTAKSQLQCQKDNLVGPPKQLYRKQVTLVDAHPAQEPVMKYYQNYKQCANTVAMERQRRMLSSDDVFGLYI